MNEWKGIWILIPLGFTHQIKGIIIKKGYTPVGCISTFLCSELNEYILRAPKGPLPFGSMNEVNGWMNPHQKWFSFMLQMLQFI